MTKGEDYTGVSVSFLGHDGAGKLLLAKRSERCRDEWHTWETGGGGVKFGENVEDALVRELKEEYGTAPLSFAFLGYRDLHRVHEGRPTHWVALDFAVRLDPAAVHNNEPEKCEELGWFSPDALPHPQHSQLASMIERYRDQF